jgi:dTDP-4-amino-4,6-dideoxygalactose transaminase
VDFVDVDPGTINLCPQRLAEKLAVAEKEGRLPKIVVPVHFAGQSCAMDEIHALGQRYGFRIMEDASHALGGSYLGEPIGNCRWSDMVTHSFHPVKIVTSGEGGMVTTNDAALARRLNTLRSHGITRDPAQMLGTAHGGWYYEQIELGYNYRMTDIQAALGASQMSRLETFSARRRELASLYDEALADLPVRPLARDPRGISGWHLYMIRLDLKAIRKSRREVYDALRDQGVLVNVHYIPVHLQPDYQRLGFKPGMFPEAERYYDEAITLPMFPGMSDEDVQRVKNAVANALK